jgi:hypothetical protein
MVRRPLRSSLIAPTEKQDLIEALARARSLIIRCSSGEPVGSERYQRCHAVTTAIDRLAESLTGDRELFWAKPHGGSHGTVQ